MKVQLTEAVTELKTVKETSVTSEFVNGSTVGQEWVLFFVVQSTLKTVNFTFT